MRLTKELVDTLSSDQHPEGGERAGIMFGVDDSGEPDIEPVSRDFEPSL
jgi:hypothetical protein